MTHVIELLEGFLELAVPLVAAAAELIGLIIIVFSLLKAAYHCALWLLRHRRVNYNFRHEMGSGLATALEFLMAAEVSKTILLPDLHSVLLLASIFGLRALMSLLIHAEIRGPRPKAHHAEAHRAAQTPAAPAAEEPDGQAEEAI